MKHLRSPRIRLTALFLASLLLHLAYLHSSLAIRNYHPMDESIYWDLASNLERTGSLFHSEDVFATVGGGKKTLFWTPVYPLLLAGILKTGFAPLRLLQYIQILMVSLLPYLLYPLARTFLKGKWLWVFLALAAAYPYYFQLAAQCGSEISAAFLSLSCLALLFAEAWKSRLLLAAVGTLSAWLCLDRPEYLIFSMVILAWSSLRLVSELGWKSVLPISILSLSFGIWMGAWLYRNHAITDKLVFTTRSGYSLAYQNEYYLAYSRGEIGSEPEWIAGFPKFPSEIERYEYLKQRAAGFIRGNPAQYAQLCLKRAASFFLPSEVKAWVYHVFKRKDIKVNVNPPWFRFSNAVFLGFLWFLVLPAACIYAGKAGWAFKALGSPAGLLVLLAAGQFSVYTLFAYIEYQRAIIDLEIILLGFFFLKELRLHRNPSLEGHLVSGSGFSTKEVN